MNKLFVPSRNDFTIVSIGERGSPLQYSNHIVAIIKLYLSNVLWYYLRAANDRPYRMAWTTAMLRSGKMCCALYKLSSREGCEALAYGWVQTTAMLRSGNMRCALHKLSSREGCEALAYESVQTTAMLRSGIICCALHKLSSREGCEALA